MERCMLILFYLFNDFFLMLFSRFNSKSHCDVPIAHKGRNSFQSM